MTPLAGSVPGLIRPSQFEAGFLPWVQVVARTATPEVIALDGKTVRRSGATHTGKRPLHLVSAWMTARRLVLAHEAVDTKNNEITTVPVLLAPVDVADQIVTIDDPPDRGAGTDDDHPLLPEESAG